MQYRVDITVPAAATSQLLWDALADFGGFLNWAGGAEDEIKSEGEGVGMIRHLKMGGGELAERMTECDSSSMTLGYDLVYGEPIGMKEYRASIRVQAVASGGSELVWFGEFEPVADTTPESIQKLLPTLYEGMTQALDQYCLAQSGDAIE
ncbi:MAG: hypothetical protein ACI8Z1_000925 [Candidatus Azotimanducaceae bacterium]|jgi:hypothetical protein